MADQLSRPPLFPVFLDLRDRPCVVVGGGEVGARKVEALLTAGARVTVIDPAPEPLPEGVNIRRRPYAAGDLAGAILAFAATKNQKVNEAVGLEAKERGIFFNVADQPGECSLFMPAVLARGPLQVAVSTGGASPLLAAQMRDLLGDILGPEWAEITPMLGELRREWLPRAQKTGLSHKARKRAWEEVLALPLARLIRDGKKEAARHRAEEILEKALKM